MLELLQDGGTSCKGDWTLLKLSLFQNGFTCSQNTSTASHRFKGLSLENHLLFDGEQEGKEGVTSRGWTGRGWAGWFVMVSCCSPLFYHWLLRELQELELKNSRWYLLSAANLLYHIAVLTAPLKKLAVTVSTSVEVSRVKYVHSSHDHISA